jgi:Flp pilus assembly protein TadD
VAHVVFIAQGKRVVNATALWSNIDAALHRGAPADARTWSDLGWVYARPGKHDEASACFHMAETRDLTTAFQTPP